MQPIAEFSELGDFLNMPVRYYSAGMMVRLAFSIATAIEPEILIVDEVLAAGDLAFQAKARERMQELMSSARAVIVVSHDLASLPLMCDRVLWLDHGRMRMIGPAAEVIAAYTRASQRKARNVRRRERHAALYFSPVPAGSYAQRPHFMVRAWLDRGVESVLWVNPYPCRLPRWQDLRRRRGLDDQGTPLDPRVRVLDVPALPIEPLPLGPWLNRRLLWRKAWREHRALCRRRPADRWASAGPCALALAALGELRAAGQLFRRDGQFPRVPPRPFPPGMRRHEDAIAAEVDLVVASSTFLAEKFARRGLRVEKVLNACEDAEDGRRRKAEEENGGSGRRQVRTSQFIRLSIHPPPFALAFRPVLGYLGCMGHWFDWPLVIRLAEALPQARIELVGPCAVRAARNAAGQRAAAARLPTVGRPPATWRGSRPA